MKKMSVHLTVAFNLVFALTVFTAMSGDILHTEVLKHNIVHTTC